MKYMSTRGAESGLSFEDVLLSGTVTRNYTSVRVCQFCILYRVLWLCHDNDYSSVYILVGFPKYKKDFHWDNGLHFILFILTFRI